MKGETSRVQEKEEKGKKAVQSSSKMELSSDFIDLPEGIASKSNVDDNLFNKFKPESELKVEIDATTKSIKE